MGITKMGRKDNNKLFWKKIILTSGENRILQWEVKSPATKGFVKETNIPFLWHIFEKSFFGYIPGQP